MHNGFEDKETFDFFNNTSLVNRLYNSPLIHVPDIKLIEEALALKKKFDNGELVSKFEGMKLRGRWVPTYFELATYWLREHGAPKWYVEKGDMPSYPWKATSGGVCSDHKTKEEAQASCDRDNKREGFPLSDPMASED